MLGHGLGGVMAGSIRPRPAKGPDAFELRVFLGRDANGKVRHLTRVFHGTRRQAELELARMVVEQEEAPALVPTEQSRPWGPGTTINEAIEGWKANGWQDLSPSTTRRYASLWSTHIEPTIGRRKVAALSPYDVEVYFRQLKAKGLSEASVRQARAMLHRACRLARKWSGNVLPNPINGTELPDWSLHEQRDEVRAPTLDEVQTLLKAARERDERLYCFVLVVAATGMRRGEVCGLRWSDLDLEAGTLRVDEGVIVADGGAELKSPKTRASVRRIALDDATVEVLKARKAEVLAVAALAGVTVAPEHFAFASEVPGVLPPHPDSMSNAFRTLRRAAGVAEDVHLHSLRHFQATVLDSVISEAQKQARLGWSTVHMARHYTDGDEKEDRRAAEHVGRLLNGTGVEAPQEEQAATSRSETA